MKEKESALYSQYIIDGIRCDATPAELLEECMVNAAKLSVPLVAETKSGKSWYDAK